MENMNKNEEIEDICTEERKTEKTGSKAPERFRDRDWKEFYFVNL